MHGHRIYVKTPLGTTKRLIFRGHPTEEAAVKQFKYEQTLKTPSGVPYMPAGEVEKVEFVECPRRPAHLPPSPIDGAQ